MVATEWVFRHAGGCLIETPDLRLPPSHTVASWRWTTTVWRDALALDGWAILEWQPGERGWIIPYTSAVGDIVEFGTGWTCRDGTAGFERWWGWIQRGGGRALIIVGPYDHPADAEADARAVVDEVRLSQLAAPDLVAAVAAQLGDGQVD